MVLTRSMVRAANALAQRRRTTRMATAVAGAGAPVVAAVGRAVMNYAAKKAVNSVVSAVKRRSRKAPARRRKRKLRETVS